MPTKRPLREPNLPPAPWLHTFAPSKGLVYAGNSFAEAAAAVRQLADETAEDGDRLLWECLADQAGEVPCIAVSIRQRHRHWRTVAIIVGDTRADFDAMAHQRGADGTVVPRGQWR